MMHPLRPAAIALLAALTASPPARSAAAPDFDKVIAPLLARRCLDCHGGVKPRGGLNLTRRKTALEGGDDGPVLVPGKPGKSLLWEYVRGDKMPPKKPLPPEEKALLRAWIEAGAPWGTDPIDPFRVTTAKRAGYDWWALQPVRRPRVPVVRNAGWVRNPIDAFIARRLETRGLAPSPRADRRTLIRRLYIDLLGLPPRPEEVAAFERDAAPDAYERLVDRLLASPQYGVRWARHWLDVVRYGESNGFEFDEFRPDAWPYRDWVVHAINRDLPYDAFARLQLAGDVLRPDDPGALAATGFLVAGAYDTTGQQQQSEAMRKVVRQDELEDVVGTVSQTFLGLTVNCARCHDHKFDPIRQAEYYRLTAALGGVRHGVRSVPLPGKQRHEYERRLARLNAELADLEKPVRARLLAGRKVPEVRVPRPVASWDFTRGLRDQVGALHGALHGKAGLVQTGLRVDGKTGYVATAPLTRDLRARTLEAWVTLDNLGQRGSAVLSVQTPDGGAFDAIVFGEIEPGRWMAGSEGFARTRSFRGPAQNEAARWPVHLALVYAADGTVTLYRDGKVYGTPYKTFGPVLYRAGQSQILFGLRHSPAGGNKFLAGVIHRARLYDRALTAAEVAASAGGMKDFVSPREIAARLSPERRQRYERLLAETARLEEQLSGQAGQVYAVAPRQPKVAHLLIRGDTRQEGPVVSPGALDGLAGMKGDLGLPPDAPEAERRRRLAAWVTHPRNPLFARVIVNRLWQYHFGAGLVETSNDFGFNGGRPSHPELLDWLADELRGHGWSLKHLHRLIVTSAAYRQASRYRPEAARVDAGNRLLWRMRPRRLEAEALRDAALSVAGRLNLAMDGPSFRDVKIVQAAGTKAMLYVPLDSEGGELDRRTLYRVWARGGRSRLLDTFDCPDPSTTAPRRAVTITPLQALALLNNAFVLRTADHFAERLRREAGADVGRQIRRAYLLAYGRPPAADELALARRVVEKHGLAVLTRALLNSNEFLYVD